RAIYFDGFCTLRNQLINSGTVCFHHARLPAIALELLDETNLYPAQVALCSLACSLNHVSNWEIADPSCVESVLGLRRRILQARHESPGKESLVLDIPTIVP